MKRALLAVALILPAVAFAAGASSTDPFTHGDPAAGAKKAPVCFACHGPGGNGAINPAWPKLADQGSAYIFEQLGEFKKQTRKNPVMLAQTSLLSEDDMRNLAAYFSAQKFVPGTANEKAIAVAQPLYRGGDPARALPACAACHGPAGQGNPAAAIPRIGGQNSKYILAQLTAYQAGTRGGANAKGKMMQVIAGKLTGQEMQALASYVSGLR